MTRAPLPPACKACQTAWGARADFCEPPSSPRPWRSGELMVTVSNLNAVGWKAYNLSLTLAEWKGATHGATTMLKAQGWAADSLFDVVNGTVAVSSSGVAKVVVPPFSVVRLVVAGK